MSSAFGTHTPASITACQASQKSCYRRWRPAQPCKPPHLHRPVLRECTARRKCLTWAPTRPRVFSAVDVALTLRRDLPLPSPSSRLCCSFVCHCVRLPPSVYNTYSRARASLPYVTAYLSYRPPLPHCSLPCPRSADHPQSRPLDTHSSPSTDHRLHITHDRSLGSSLCTSISPSVVRRPPLPLLRATPAHGSYVVELHRALGIPSPILAPAS